MRKRKSLFETKAEAERAWAGVTKMAGALEIALRELVVGHVKWIEGESPRRIGLCALKQPHGGVVIVVERILIGAHYLEDWLRYVQALPAPNCKEYMPDYRAWLDLRRLAAFATEEMAKANEQAAEEAKGCQRTTLPPVVDQNVRQY